MPETFEQLVARVKANAFIGESKMPKQVKLPKGREFVFRSVKGAEAKYDWAAWLNGDLLLIEQSEGDKDDKGNVIKVTVKKDYEVNTRAMPGKVKFAGRKKYKIVEVSTRDHTGAKLADSLIIRARDMDADERVAEDLLRAEEKVKAEERRKAQKIASVTAVGDDEADEDAA